MALLIDPLKIRGCKVALLVAKWPTRLVTMAPAVASFEEGRRMEPEPIQTRTGRTAEPEPGQNRMEPEPTWNRTGTESDLEPEPTWLPIQSL